MSSDLLKVHGGSPLSSRSARWGNEVDGGRFSEMDRVLLLAPVSPPSSVPAVFSADVSTVSTGEAKPCSPLPSALAQAGVRLGVHRLEWVLLALHTPAGSERRDNQGTCVINVSLWDPTQYGRRYSASGIW